MKKEEWDKMIAEVQAVSEDNERRASAPTVSDVIRASREAIWNLSRIPNVTNMPVSFYRRDLETIKESLIKTLAVVDEALTWGK